MSDLPEVPNVTQPTPAPATAGLPAGPATTTPDAAPSPTSTPSAMGGTPAPATAAPAQSGTPSSPAAASMGGTPPTGPSSANTSAPPQPQLTPDQQRAMAVGTATLSAHNLMDPSKSRPGSIWRTILSSALVGAAAGAGHGWEGAGEGMKAATKLREDQQKRQQQQFENERQKQKDALEERKEDREKSVAESQILHNKALTAMANQSTLKDAVQVRGMSQAEHDLLVARDKPELEMFQAAGLKPYVGKDAQGNAVNYENIRESDAVKMQHEPGFTGKRWLVTGVVPTRDKDGNIVSYENTYSAYDPQQSLPLTDSQVKQWEEDGLLDANPNLLTSNVITTDPATGQKTIKYVDYRNLQAQAAPLRQIRLQREKQDYDKQHDQDQLKLLEAQTRHDNAAAAAETQQGGKAAFELTEEKNAKSARVKYNSKGWDGLTDDERYYVQGDLRQQVKTYQDLLNGKELKEEESSTDLAVKQAAYDKAHEYRKQIEEISAHLIPETTPKTSGTGSPAVATAVTSAHKVTLAASSLASKNPDEARKTVDALTGYTPDEKIAILQTLSQQRRDDAEYNRQLLAGLGDAVIRRITGRF